MQVDSKNVARHMSLAAQPVPIAWYDRSAPWNRTGTFLPVNRPCETGWSQVSRTHPYYEGNERIYKWKIIDSLPAGSQRFDRCIGPSRMLFRRDKIVENTKTIEMPC